MPIAAKYGEEVLIAVTASVGRPVVVKGASDGELLNLWSSARILCPANQADSFVDSVGDFRFRCRPALGAEHALSSQGKFDAATCVAQLIHEIRISLLLLRD